MGGVSHWLSSQAGTVQRYGIKREAVKYVCGYCYLPHTYVTALRCIIYMSHGFYKGELTYMERVNGARSTGPLSVRRSVRLLEDLRGKIPCP